MSVLCFIDTETTSLRPDRRAWEIGLIRREPGKPDVEHSWFVDRDSLDLGNADLTSLKIGRFYDRHPQANRSEDGALSVVQELDALADVEFLTRGAHLVGCVPNFDADVLDTRMRTHGILPSWHYHLIDVEALAIGYVSGVAARAVDEAEMRGDKPPTVDWSRGTPPWNSEDLSRACGVEPPGAEDRHTALGDARWAMRLHDAIVRPVTP